MKKTTIFTLLTIFVFQLGNAQMIKNFDANASWNGFLVWAGPSGDGSGIWGVADLVAIIDTGADNVTLKPNRVNDLDPYWQTVPAGLFGEKVMRASLYVEDATLGATNFTWTGSISSNNLSNSYGANAFIKIFADGYALLEEISVPINASGDYSVNYGGGVANAAIIQYGLEVVGSNVNPEAQYDADYDALGSVVIGPASLSLKNSELNSFKIAPNPSNTTWNIQSKSQNIISIQVYDILGKQIMTMSPNAQNFEIDASKFDTGMYLAKIKTDNGVKTLRLIKQ